MNNIILFRHGLAFFFLIIVQVFFAKNLDLFGIAFCFIYINFILLLPLQTNPMLLLILGFLIGFVVDNFYDTLGIHSAACVLIAFLRPHIINLLSSKNEIAEILIKDTGLTWFVRYIFGLTFIHHLLLFFLQQFNFTMILDTLVKVFASTLFTGLVILIIQYLFYSPIVSNARK